MAFYPYDKKAFLRNVKNICFWIICSLFFVTASVAYADMVNYSLDNVILDDGTQMHGTFTWTFNSGDFENGVGQFIFLDIPHTSHDHTDLNTTIDVSQSIEITLAGSTHDDGVDITLFLSQPLTPATSSFIDLIRSKYEIGGNGFHTGLFLGGRIALDTGPEVVYEDGFETK